MFNYYVVFIDLQNDYVRIKFDMVHYEERVSLSLDDYRVWGSIVSSPSPARNKLAHF